MFRRSVRRECELLVERARKWKDRSRSGARQVEKLHQVLQNIAKLLQIEGATPNAVSTIESLLRELVPAAPTRRGDHRQQQQQQQQPEPTRTRVEEARVCVLCGKMFSSQEFLDKHTLRRHAAVDMQAIDSGRSKPARHTNVPPAPETTAPTNQSDPPTDRAGGELKSMLRAVEQALHDHQATLRKVAQEEANKLHTLYEQLHVETQLAEEMRAKRVAIEHEAEKKRRELDAFEQEKQDVAEELRVMKEQLAFLAMKKKIEAQNGACGSPQPQAVAANDPTVQLELRRLEETVAMLKDALATAREELQKSHERHGSFLKEKATLDAQLHEARNHARRLEASSREVQDHVPAVRVDAGVQSSVATTSAMCQTDESIQEPSSVLPARPPPPVVPRVRADEAAVQTDGTDRAECMDSMMQTDPEHNPPPMQSDGAAPSRSPTKSIGVSVDADLVVAGGDLDSVFKIKCASILDLVQRRADRSAHVTTPVRADDASEDKIYSSLPRRRYLRSRFLHEERAVAERIAGHVAKLEQTSLRFGVSPKSTVLANEHIEVVQRALHAHLEVLPAEVLQRMIDIENRANALIQNHWVHQEMSRQQALERLTAGLEAKSQANQGLVRQAMAAFGASANGDDSTVTSMAPSQTSRVMTQGTTTPNLTEEEASTSRVTTGPRERTCVQNAEPDESNNPDPSVADGEGRDFDIQPVANVADSPPSDESAALRLASRQPPSPPPEPETPLNTRCVTPPPTSAEPISTQEQGEPSPVSVQEVRRQAVAVRSVKVVSVSPTSSPPKRPPRALPAEQQQAPVVAAEDAVLEHEGHAGTSAGRGDTAHAADPPTTAIPAVLSAGVSAAHTRGPSLFSAKHPESQLGIVIPSRYDPPTTITVHGVRDDPDQNPRDNAYDHRRPPSQNLRWSESAGSAGRSGGASERSFSAVESSEMSFDASIPSLGSEDVGVSRSFPRSSVDHLPTVPSSPIDDERGVHPSDAALDSVADSRETIELIPEGSSDAEDNTVQTLGGEEATRAYPSEQQQSPRASPPRASEVLALEDDSDIEEVVLS